MQSEKLKNLLGDYIKYKDYGTDDKIKEINRIRDYGFWNGFVDENGNKSEYMLKKLREAGIPLSGAVELNFSTNSIELLDKDGDYIIEYHGVTMDTEGKISVIKLGEINYSEEFRSWRKDIWLRTLDFFLELFMPKQIPIFPIYPDKLTKKPDESKPDEAPKPTPPDQTPTPEPPDPAITREKNNR